MYKYDWIDWSAMIVVSLTIGTFIGVITVLVSIKT